MPDTVMGRRLVRDTSRHADFCRFSLSIGGPCQCGLETAVGVAEHEAAAPHAAQAEVYRVALVAARDRFEHAHDAGDGKSVASDLWLGMGEIDAALAAGQKDGTA